MSEEEPERTLLDVPDELAISAIVEGRPLYEAAELAGYSARTLQRRQHDPEFKRRLAEVRNERVAQIAGQLGSLVDDAIDALRRALEDQMFPQVPLRAAGLVLDKFRLYRKEFEMADEMAAMREELRILRAMLTARDGGDAAGEEGVA